MKNIQAIRKDFADNWQTLSTKHWRCAAQKQFGIAWVKPMLEEIDGLDAASDELDELCKAAAAAAASVREPDNED